MTTRRWMIAVAAVGLLASGAVSLERRRHGFLTRARFHAEEHFGIVDEIAPPNERRWEDYWFLDRKPEPLDADERRGVEAWKRSRERRLAYHEAMYHKYERAARRPWLPVRPDPPPPE